MVNIVLKGARGAYYLKICYKVLEKAKAGNKRYFPLIAFYDSKLVKGYCNIKLSKVLSLYRALKVLWIKGIG